MGFINDNFDEYNAFLQGTQIGVKTAALKINEILEGEGTVEEKFERVRQFVSRVLAAREEYDIDKTYATGVMRNYFKPIK